ncbi:MAG: radical SAM protein [Oscillospiraceae bacterium]|nr:radical SAM protein [Oscillospiraceae bacterium]
MICTLCPRQCGALRDELHGEGFCRMPSLPVCARAALHFWEEPCISGQTGAGTVFFSGCTLGCVFCQNRPISRENFGKTLTPDELYAVFGRLADQGAACIELVTPTHFTHVLAKVLERPVPGGLPVVWNSGGYERRPALRTLEGRIDVYLPDLKYLTPALAEKYSGAADYPEAAQAAILEMYRQRGPARIEGGLLKSGVLIRHLILPGHVGEAKRVMDWVAEAFPPGAVLFSLMAQYTPVGPPDGFPELGRPLRPSELRAARAYMEGLGLAGYVQELGSSGEGFIPAFDLTGL